MDRNLALEAVRVTEAAALNCARWTGRGDEKAADQAAVDAMRKAFDALAILSVRGSTAPALIHVTKSATCCAVNRSLGGICKSSLP